MTAWAQAEGATRIKAEKDRQRADLIAKSPLRKPVMQHSVNGLGLFDAERSPGLL